MGTLNFTGTADTEFSVPGTHTIYDGPLIHSTDGLGVYTDTFLFVQLVDNEICSGDCYVEVEIDWDGLASPTSASEMGLCFIDSDRTGFSLIAMTGSTRLRNEVEGSGGTDIASTTFTYSGIVRIGIAANTISKNIEVFVDDVSILTGTYTGDFSSLRCGIQQYAGWGNTSVNRSLLTQPSITPPEEGGLKICLDGTTFVEKPLKVSLDGTTFVEKPLRRWGGSAWIPAFITGAIIFNFSDGDTYSTVKDGMSWDSGRTIEAPSGETEEGGVFTWGPNAYPAQDDSDEQGFYFDPMGEFWYKMRFFVPSNYFHRFTLRLTVSGDLSSWVVGDTILGTDGVKSGELYYIDGSEVHLLFPDDAGSSIVWSGTITNSTRGQSRSSTRVGFQSSNNKLLAIWCDGYSGAGTSPTIVWEILPDGLGGSTLYYHYAVDGGGTGQSGSASTSSEQTFIEPGDVGKWLDFIVHVKMATTEFGTDGVIEGWKRIEGAGSYTKLWTQTNAFIGERDGAGLFRRGYTHGWANSGFKEETKLYDSLIVLSPSTIDGVS